MKYLTTGNWLNDQVPKCEDCRHSMRRKRFASYGNETVFTCNLTKHSTSWERASMIQGDPPGKGLNAGLTNARELFIKNHPNCGYRAKFFKKAIP